MVTGEVVRTGEMKKKWWASVQVCTYTHTHVMLYTLFLHVVYMHR